MILLMNLHVEEHWGGTEPLCFMQHQLGGLSWRLEDSFSKWLTHTAGNLVLAVSESSAGAGDKGAQFLSMVGLSTGCLGFLMAW